MHTASAANVCVVDITIIMPGYCCRLARRTASSHAMQMYAVQSTLLLLLGNNCPSDSGLWYAQAIAGLQQKQSTASMLGKLSASKGFSRNHLYMLRIQHYVHCCCPGAVLGSMVRLHDLTTGLTSQVRPAPTHRPVAWRWSLKPAPCLAFWPMALLHQAHCRAPSATHRA